MKAWKVIIVAVLMVVLIFSAASLLKLNETLSGAGAKFDELAAKVSSAPHSQDVTAPPQEDSGEVLDDGVTEEELADRETREELAEAYGFLHEQNPDYVGWLKIDDTVVDYPVVQTPKDPNHYLYLDFDGQYSISGVPFADSECDIDPASDNIIIYAHNMKNGSMFGSLKKYADEDYWSEHRYVTFDTLAQYGVYEIIAVYKSSITEDGEDDDGFCYYEWTDFRNAGEFDQYMENIDALALFDTGLDASFGDQLLTLSTCSSHTEKGRFVVLAKKID